MKPCSKNRKLIAWLALGSLETERAMALREHLASCDGCRRYLNELSKVTETLRAVEMNSGIRATASFHQRVAARIKAGEASPFRQDVRDLLRATLLNRRVAMPVAGGLAVVLGLLLVSREPSEVALPAPSSPQIASQHNVDSDLRPTVANYQMVANQSLEKLDQLLTEQGSRKLPPAPIYTASNFATAGMSD